MVFQNRIYFSNTADSKKKFKQKLATILNHRKVFSTIQIIHFKKKCFIRYHTARWNHPDSLGEIMRNLAGAALEKSF